MKTYKRIMEDIGLTTGAGIANYDPVLQRKPPKRYSLFEALGICEEHMKPFTYHDGKMECEACVVRVAK
jgi:hypothetical protein